MNKILILFAVILMSSFDANAAEITFVNAFPIYTYGDVSYITTVYEFIKSVATDVSVQTILGLGFSVAIFISGWRARFGGFADIAKSAIAPITLYALFAVPTVNVHITDLRVDKGIINYPTPDGGYKKVEDVPYAIAFIPSSVSLIVSLFIDLIDDNWNGVNIGNKFSTLGFQKTARLTKEAMILAKFRDLNVSGGDVAHDMNQYIKTCLITEALKVPGNEYILQHPSKPFPDMLDPTIFKGNIGSKTVTFDNGVDSNGSAASNITCSYAYNKYVSGKANDIEDSFGVLLSNREGGKFDVNNADLNQAFRDTIGDAANTVGTITKAMATTAATRALEKSLDTEGIGVNGVAMATELSIDSTLANLRTEGLAKWDWITRAVPDGISIVLAILIGAFPIMVVVMSFLGKHALGGIANYFMGYMAINFNLVSLALVNNIISYYTSQHAVEAMASYAGMPFGLTQINDFMMQQADMTGLAGIIGAVSVFAVTPLIFKGETAGFSAAMSAISGAYRGNVVQSAEKTLTDYDAQQKLDQQALTTDGMNEAQAAAWLSKEGFSKPNNMSAVAAYNDMMKNYGSIGSADAASIMHSGNAGKFNTSNYIAGSEAQSLQSMGKTAGLGASMNGGVVSEAEIESVSMQDGEAVGAMLGKTAELRGGSDKYNPNDVGAGQAISQFAKDMASVETNKEDPNANLSVANATKGVVDSMAAARGLLHTGALNPDGTVMAHDGNGNPMSMNGKMQDYAKGVASQTAEKFSSTAGHGSTIDIDKAMDKSYEDGARSAKTINAVDDKMRSGERDKNGNLLYDRDMAAMGQADNEMAQHAKNMATAKAISENMTGEKNGYADFISGNSALARKQANDAIGVGEDWQKLSEKEQIALMAKDKTNAAAGFRGDIEATNAKIKAQGGVDDYIDTQTTAASLKAKTEQDVLDKQLKNAGADKGLDDSTKDLAKAIDKLAQTAGTIAGGKTASDIASTGKYDSPEQYAEAQAQKASAQATIDKTRFDKSSDLKMTQMKLDKMREDVNNKELFDKQAIDSGMAVRGADGKLVATTGQKFTDALAAVGAGDMSSSTQLIMGDERMNVDTDIDGNTFVHRDSQENIKRGRESSYGITGYPEHLLGGTGEALMFGLGGLGLAEGYARTAGAKNGVVKPAFKKTANSLAGMFGADKPFPESPNEPVNSSGQSNNSQSTDSAKGKSKNGVHSDSLKKYTNSITKNTGDGKIDPKTGFFNNLTNNGFVNKALHYGGKAVVGADAILSGYDAYQQFKEGDTKHGILSTAQSVTAAAFVAKPNPVTGVAYGLTTATNMVVGATDYLSKNGNTTYTGNNPLGAGIDPYNGGKSPVPSYVKNAFSTPSGFNTMQAMNTKSAYGDMTDVKNIGSAIHKTDHAQTTVDKLQDINIASDYQQESIEEQNEVSREFMEKLINDNYNKGDL